MEYADAKYKQLAVEYALKLSNTNGMGAQSLVAEAKIIEAYLKENSAVQE